MKQKTEEIAAKKRKPVGEIKYQLSLNEEQKEAKRIILENPVTVVKGAAGSGKTLVSCAVGLDMLFKRDMRKIVITRPTVTTGEELGFLPGGVFDKTLPFLMPIYHNLYMLYDKEKIDKMIQDGIIEICPLAFFRGRTFTDSFIIVDECQNMTNLQTEGFLGRLGLNSKMVFCGDLAQIDLKNKRESGLDFLSKQVAADVPGVKSIVLKQNHRHPILTDILKVYESYR